MGYLHGTGETLAPDVKDARRAKAITSVRSLFRGFIERFGDNECLSLTGCDWSNRRDILRFFKEEVYKGTCFHYFNYVLNECLDQAGSMNRSD